jgi:exodeoxyribonuclease VII small subunit
MTDEQTVPEISYADALAEVESILESIEASEVDIDELGSHVARAAELIALCRARIKAAELEVERIVTAMEDARPAPDTGAG